MIVDFKSKQINEKETKEKKSKQTKCSDKSFEVEICWCKRLCFSLTNLELNRICYMIVLVYQLHLVYRWPTLNITLTLPDK